MTITLSTSTTTNTGGPTTWYYHTQQYQYVYPPTNVWGNFRLDQSVTKTEDGKVEKCHLCKVGELECMFTDEWREDISKKKDKSHDWEWNKTTEKRFSCGTVCREGDWDFGSVIRPVVLGEACVQLD